MTNPLILASASPRRRELLAHLGIPFEIVVSNFDETSLPTTGYSPNEWVMQIAKAKAAEVSARSPDDAIVIGADTTVTLDGQYFNKPLDSDDAVRMLSKLSGRTHSVYTGVCIILNNASDENKIESFCSCTEVTFDPLSPAKIKEYVATGEPLDKAGGYGIQGVSLAFIPQIYGDYYNVVGLPVGQLRDVLVKYYPEAKQPPPQPIFSSRNYSADAGA